MNPALVAAGAVSGFLVGLTGVGGGALMTPVLLLFFDVAPVAAVGTDLWFAALTKLPATRIHQARRLIDWTVVRLMWYGSLTASAVTLVAITYGPASTSSVGFLKRAIGIAVLLSAFMLLFQERLLAIGRERRRIRSQKFRRLQAPSTVVAGAALGALVTLTSVGAGAIGAPILAYLYPLRLTPPRLIATDIVHAIPLAVFAGLGHLLIGNVEPVLLGTLLLGSLPGVIAGAVLSARLPFQILRVALSLTLAAVAIKLILPVRL